MFPLLSQLCHLRLEGLQLLPVFQLPLPRLGYGFRDARFLLGKLLPRLVAFGLSNSQVSLALGNRDWFGCLF